MIDGRTIHQFLQFVEPLLVEAGTLPTSSGYRHLEGYTEDSISVPYVIGGKSLDSAQQHVIRIRADKFYAELLCNIKRHLKTELLNLAAYGMSFMSEFGLDCITIEHSTRQELMLGEVSIDPQLASDMDSHGLLRLSATNVFSKFVLAEEYASNQIGFAPNQGIDILRTLFAEAVCFELDRRMLRKGICLNQSCVGRSNLPEPRPFYELLQSIEGHFLVCELAGYWYPGWARSKLIFDSPFDTASDLRSVYPHLTLLNARI
jgi:hypothetical protein